MVFNHVITDSCLLSPNISIPHLSLRQLLQRWHLLPRLEALPSPVERRSDYFVDFIDN